MSKILLGVGPTKINKDALVHLETSVGVLQNLDSGFSNFLKERGTLLLLDVVASYGGIELELDKWGVDIAYASTQKCLSAPSGLALISYNDNARREIEKNAQKVNWCYDFSNIYRHISEGVYPYTTPLFLLNVLDSILNYIMKFGKETYINKQRHSGTRVKEIFESIGLKMLPESIWEAPQVKVFYTPPELDSYKIINVLEEYGIEISPGIGKLKHSIIRLGKLNIVEPELKFKTIKHLYDSIFLVIWYQLLVQEKIYQITTDSKKILSQR